MRPGDPDQLVGGGLPGVVDHHRLDVLRERVVQLAVARDDLCLDRRGVELRASADRVHLRDELGKLVGDHEVDAVFLERLDRAGRALREPRPHQVADVAPREVGVLFRARERELLLDDRLRQHEPRVVVPGGENLRHGSDRVGAGHPGHAAQTLAVGVEPHRRRSGQNPDRMIGPDGVPVVHALGVGPHPVAVDDAPARPFGDLQHPAVDVGGDAADQVRRRRPDPVCGPVAPHQLVIVADSSGGDHDAARPDLETVDHLARR